MGSEQEFEAAREHWQAVWRWFKEQGKVRSQWDWGNNWEGRSYFLTYLIPLGTSSPLTKVAKGIQRNLRLSFIDAVPPKSLHVTVQGVDFVENLTAPQSEALRNMGQTIVSEMAPFALTIRNVNSFGDAAILEIYDGGNIRAIRARLREAMPWLAERDSLVRDGQDRFMPHVSIAYYNRQEEKTRVAEAIEDFRQYPVAEVTVDSIQLVRVPKPTDHYEWTVDATFRLDGEESR